MIDRIISQLGGHSFLENALKSNLDWIERSFTKNDNKGSSAYLTSWGTWSKVYPETTGYLIPTLLQAHNYFKDHKYLDLARNQVVFLKSIQNADGSFFQATDKKEPIVFDTAQILLGFNAIHKLEGGYEKDLESILAWLLSVLSEKGEFVSHNYRSDYNPAYYARVLWPIYEALFILKKDLPEKLNVALSRINALQNSNGSFNQWSFDGKDSAFTHTIIYTLRGLRECEAYTEANTNYHKTLDKILHLVNKEKWGGTFDQDWNSDQNFICSAGNAQLAILILKLYRDDGIEKYLNILSPLLYPLLKSQRTKNILKGGIPSSYPVYGKYQRFRYTNWTQKFFSDAILQLLQSK